MLVDSSSLIIFGMPQQVAYQQHIVMQGTVVPSGTYITYIHTSTNMHGHTMYHLHPSPSPPLPHSGTPGGSTYTELVDTGS